VPFAFVLGVFFLYFGRIEQDYLSNLGGRGSAEKLAFETISNELGQQPAVVEVGVCEQNGVNRIWRNSERLPVSGLEITFLVQSAVDENLAAVGLEQMA